MPVRTPATPKRHWPAYWTAASGGSHHYFGEYCFKPYIGNRLRPLTTTDMQQAVAVNWRAEILMILTGILLYLL